VGVFCGVYGEIGAPPLSNPPVSPLPSPYIRGKKGG